MVINCIVRATAMTHAELMSRLIENAIDFLIRAIEEFQSKPKYSIIHFYTAVELFLKARLLHEHWSLVVLKDPDRTKFESGDFISVSFEVSCERLRKVAQSPVPESAQRNFDTIRKHRNKMVHFFHQAGQTPGPDIEAVAKEQLRAWYDLDQLLRVQWSPIFNAYSEKLSDIERKLKGHREYLKAKFDGFAERIKSDSEKGVLFDVCNSCRFKAAPIRKVIGDLHEATCLVCGHWDAWLDYTCPNCDEVGRLQDGGEFTCWNCGHKDNERALVDQLNEFKLTQDNYYDAIVPANCGDCEGYHTVVQYRDKYLCVVCLAVVNELNQCGWCGEHNTGEMDGSSYAGCSACDGSAGWHADKD
jgi:hypothetical protein